MAQAKGSKGQIVIDFETTYGSTPDTPAGILCPVNSSALKSTRNQIESATITGRRDPIEPSDGNIDVSGSITVPVDILNFGNWLKALLGDPVTTGTGPYNHTFQVSDDVPSLVIEQGFTDINQFFLFNGCKIDSMSIDIGGDNELTADFGIIGAKETLDTSSFDAAPDELALTKFQNFQAAITEGGSSLATARNLKMSFANNLDAGSYVIGGGGIRGALPEGIVSISGSLEAMFEDATLLDKAIDSTESSLVTTFTSGTNSLELTINELTYKRNSPELSGPGGIWVSLEFTGYFQNASPDDTCFQAVLINDQASY